LVFKSPVFKPKPLLVLGGSGVVGVTALIVVSVVAGVSCAGYYDW